MAQICPEIKALDDLQPDSQLAHQWSKLVRSNPASGFMQTLEWANFKKQQGIACKHLGIFEDNKLVAGAIFYYMAAEHGSSFLVAPEGPVLPWHDEDRVRHFLSLLVQHCEKAVCASGKNIIGMRIEPRLPLPLPDTLFEFGRAPMDLVPRETLYLDLAQSAAEILASMKPKGRYNTKLSERKEVTVREGTAGEIIDVFYPLLCQAGRRDNFAVEPLSFFVEVASTLLPTGMIKLLLAELDGECLGGLLMTVCGERATYLYGGISNTRRNVMAGYQLQWQAIKLAQQAGCTVYDMYGYDQFCNPRNRYGRFSRFKSQFGGRVQKFVGAHDYYFIDQIADTMVKVLKEVDN